jgi:putative nucleotidyltransferase with HDIG domain
VYKIDSSKSDKRTGVEKWLRGLDLVSAPTREKIVTAWVSTWTSSEYAELPDMPWDPGVPDYKLMEHVNEVTELGLTLAAQSKKLWGTTLDPEILVPILILHDVDKPLMFVRRGNQVVHSDLYSQIPHGVVGAMLLKELGFPHTVVSTVGAHSPRMPFHGKNYEAFVLHYADHYACDHAMLKAGKTPLYFYLDLPAKL